MGSVHEHTNTWDEWDLTESRYFHQGVCSSKILLNVVCAVGELWTRSSLDVVFLSFLLGQGMVIRCKGFCPGTLEECPGVKGEFIE